MMLEGPTTKTTIAEQKVLDFLFSHKGEEFNAGEIQKQTGIRADLIESIVDNLRWKGFDIVSNRGKYYFVKNSIWSYIIGIALISFVAIMLMGAWMDHLESNTKEIQEHQKKVIVRAE